jgi:hypothetical protein
MSEPHDKNVRKIAGEYERTGEERVGPDVTGGPASDSPPPSGSPV